MRIGDIFAKVAEFMKVYTAYVNNYNEAFKVFTDYIKFPEVSEVPPSLHLPPSLFPSLHFPEF
jgi:hypothetical protein